MCYCGCPFERRTYDGCECRAPRGALCYLESGAGDTEEYRAMIDDDDPREDEDEY